MIAEGYLPGDGGARLAGGAGRRGDPFSPSRREGVPQGAIGTRCFSAHLSLLPVRLEYSKVQPHNLSPNSILVLSNFAALCEGYLGIRPRLDLFVFFTVKR